MPDLPGGSNAVAVPSWLAAIVGAWFVSPELGTAATVGYVSQWALKAPARIRDWVAPAAVVLSCLLLYVFVLGHAPKDWHPDRAWFAAFATWAAAALGIGSAAGRTGGAAKTNSL